MTATLPPIPQDERYSRHLALPQVGRKGQQRLLQARVLVCGAGGLGSPAAMYLAAAGVGTIGLIDFDVVEASNLQRQILHGESSIGMPKPASAAHAIRQLNSDVVVEQFHVRLGEGSLHVVEEGWDVIVDGLDNAEARYALNRRACELGIPLVHAAVHRFEGRLTVLSPAQGGPCYHCLYPQQTGSAVRGECGPLGVLGAVTGVVGSLQALETVKLVTGAGSPAVGRLVVFDGLHMRFHSVDVHADPACTVCGAVT